MVYIYQSCSSLSTFSTKLTQVIQTDKVSFVDYPETIFKDKNNTCWKYLGEYENTYIAPSTVFNVTYQGNFFESESNLSQIYYEDCDSCVITIVSACTEIFFSSERCDNNEIVVVKTCDVGPIKGNIKLSNNVGDTCGVKNPYGDDFCVQLKSQIYDVQTDYIINTPAWKDFDCYSCPKYKLYDVSSLDNFIQNIKVYDYVTSETLVSGTSVTINTDESCYVINSYDGIVINYLYNPTSYPTIKEVFTTSADCMINYYKTIL